MKKLFTLMAVACFSYATANAQSKTAIKAERITKVESKETLKRAQVQEPQKMDAATFEQKRKNVTRIDAGNAKKLILTEEQSKAIIKERSATETNFLKAD